MCSALPHRRAHLIIAANSMSRQDWYSYIASAAVEQTCSYSDFMYRSILTRKHFMFLMPGQLFRQARSAGPEREKLGKCIANLAYVAGSERKAETASGGLDWVYTFRTATAACREDPPLTGMTQLLDTDLGDAGIAEKELVVVSVEGEEPKWMQRKDRRWVTGETTSAAEADTALRGRVSIVSRKPAEGGQTAWCCLLQE